MQAENAVCRKIIHNRLIYVSLKKPLARALGVIYLGRMKPYERLSAWLAIANVTAADFGRRCDYDGSNMAKVARGVVRPGVKLAFRIEVETGGAIPAKAWAD